MKGGRQRRKRTGREVGTPSRDESLEVTMAALGYMGRALVGNHVRVKWHKFLRLRD